jgi:CRP/FNR family transcriptional regulator
MVQAKPEALQVVAYFSSLSAAELRWLAGATSLRRMGTREVLIREGEPCTGFYGLLEGRARIYKTSRSGRQQVLAVLLPHDTFNEVPVFDGGPNPATVETLEPSSVLEVPRETALALIGRSPHAALTLLASFAARLRGFSQLVESLAFDDVNRRLARFIAQLAESEGRPSSDGIVVARSLTLQDVAAMIGTVREVVTRGLTQLEREGLLQVHRNELVVLDLDALKRFGQE